MIQLFGENVWQFLIKVIHQFYNLACPLVGIYPTGMKMIFIHKETYKKNIMALVIVAPE